MNERFIADKLAEYPKGWSAKVRPIIPYANISLSKTALHEAKHLVLLHANGTGAKSGTIEPGPGYLGMVEPHGFDAVAALGPDADGDTGTDHDKRVAAWGGADIDSSRKVARTMLNRLREEVRLVAGLLEVERTVSGGRVSEVINKYQQDPDEEVEVVDPIGNITTTKTPRSKRHEILFGVNEKNKHLENKDIKKVRNFRPLNNKLKISTKIAA